MAPALQSRLPKARFGVSSCVSRHAFVDTIIDDAAGFVPALSTQICRSPASSLADGLPRRLDHVRRCLEHALDHGLQALAIDRRDLELQLVGFGKKFGI